MPKREIERGWFIQRPHCLGFGCGVRTPIVLDYDHLNFPDKFELKAKLGVMRRATGEPVRLYNYKDNYGAAGWETTFERELRMMNGPRTEAWGKGRPPPEIRTQPYGRRGEGGLSPVEKANLQAAKGKASYHVTFELLDPKPPKGLIDLVFTSFNFGGPDKPHEEPPRLVCPSCGFTRYIIYFLDWSDTGE
jgi:hypothetical protein